MKVVKSETIPLTNAEVLEWLREKSFTSISKDDPSKIKPPRNTVEITSSVRKYIETSPAGNVSTKAIQELFTKLAPYKLSRPELLMICNVRPEAFAHLTALIANDDSRFDDNQLTEILDIINTTLEPRYRGTNSTPAPPPPPTAEEKVQPDEELEQDAHGDDTTAPPDREDLSQKDEIQPSDDTKPNPATTQPEGTSIPNSIVAAPMDGVELAAPQPAIASEEGGEKVTEQEQEHETEEQEPSGDFKGSAKQRKRMRKREKRESATSSERNLQQLESAATRSSKWAPGTTRGRIDAAITDLSELPEEENEETRRTDGK